MTKFTMINEDEDRTINTIIFSAEIIDDVINHFKDFLRGCTFSEKLIEQIGRDESFGDINYDN